MGIIFFRTLILFSALLIFMRLMGKRQLGELELNELIVSMLIADVAANLLVNKGLPLIYALIPILSLFCMELILAGLMLRFARLRTVFFGRPRILIERGVIRQAAMRKCRFSIDELMVELRRQSIQDLATVENAILETDGTVSIILFPEHRPVTAGQMNCTPESELENYIVISDGHIFSENLKKCGKDETWLRKECRKRGAVSTRDVFLFISSTDGKIYFAAKDRGL